MKKQTSKSVAELDRELKVLRSQLNMVQKQREAKSREMIDLTKKFKVGQVLRFNPTSTSKSMSIYKVLKVQRDRLVTQQIFISPTNVVIYHQKVTIPYYNTSYGVKVNRKQIAKRLKDFENTVAKARRELLGGAK